MKDATIAGGFTGKNGYGLAGELKGAGMGKRLSCHDDYIYLNILNKSKRVQVGCG